MRHTMTEKYVPYNRRLTTKVDEDKSNSFRFTRKCNYEIPVTKRRGSWGSENTPNNFQSRNEPYLKSKNTEGTTEPHGWLLPTV